MVFSPYEFDAGRGLICCIFDKIRERRQGSAVICFNNRNSLINASRTEGIYLNGGHNSSFFLLVSASSLRQVIEDKTKAGVSQEPDLCGDNTSCVFSPVRHKAAQREEELTGEYIKDVKFTTEYYNTACVCKQFSKKYSELQLCLCDRHRG